MCSQGLALNLRSVWGLGFGVKFWGSGCRVWGLGSSQASALGWDLGCRGLGLTRLGLGVRVIGSGCEMWGFGFRQGCSERGNKPSRRTPTSQPAYLSLNQPSRLGQSVILTTSDLCTKIGDSLSCGVSYTKRWQSESKIEDGPFGPTERVGDFGLAQLVMFRPDSFSLPGSRMGTTDPARQLDDSLSIPVKQG